MFSGPISARGLAIRGFDNDGTIDIFAACRRSDTLLLPGRQCRRLDHWLRLRTRSQGVQHRRRRSHHYVSARDFEAHADREVGCRSFFRRPRSTCVLRIRELTRLG